MELGATVCTPRAPRCVACPAARFCDARAAGDAEALPVKAKRRAPLPMRGAAALLLRGGKALAVRRPPHGLLGGLWDLPGGELAEGESAQAGLARALGEGVGLRAARVRRIGAVEHVFTHRVLRLQVFRASAAGGRVRLRGFDAHRWVAPESLAKLPHGTATAKALALLGVAACRSK